MRRTRAFALFIAVVLGVGASPLRAQTIAVSPGGERSAGLGSQLDVPIVVDMTTRSDMLGAFAMRITWNPAVLRFDATTPGSFGAVTARVDSVGAGIMRIAAANPAGAGGLITVSSLRMTVLLADTTTIALNVSQLFAAQSFTDLLPFSNVSGGPFCPARGRYGDVDGDGAANSRDALIALSNAVGLPTAPFDITLGDVDADGSTNARDALIVLSGAVGLNVSAYRVLAVAGGACATELPATMALTPSATGDLELGQAVRFEARVADGFGQLQTVRNAVWLSSDATIVAVFPDGRAVARGAGLVTVTAIKDGRDSASVSVNVTARRTTHVVDALAAGATNTIGSPQLPYARIQDAIAASQDGDTIRVRPGTYSEAPVLDRDALLVGDTLPNGDRPTIVHGDAFGFGLTLAGVGARRVEQIGFRDLPVAMFVNGVTTVDLDGLRADNVGSAIYAYSPMTHFSVRRSRLLGGLTSTASGYGMLVVSPIDTLLIQDNEFGDFTISALDVSGPVVATIRHNTLRDAGAHGVRIGDSNAQASDTSRVLFEDNAVLRSGFAGLVAVGTGQLTSRHNRFVSRPNAPDYTYVLTHVRRADLVRDSIHAGAASIRWMNGFDVDTLTMDSSDVEVLSADGTVDDGHRVTVKNSTFRSITDAAVFSLFQVLFQGSAPNLSVRNVLMTGDVSCDACGSGFVIGDGTPVTVDSLRTINVGRPLHGGDSVLTVTRSSFRHFTEAIRREVNYTNPPTTITGSTFDDWTGYAMVLEHVGVLVDSNTFSNGNRVAVMDAWVPATVTRNRITNVREGFSVSIGDTTQTARFNDNVFDQLDQYAIAVFGAYSDSTAYVEMRRDSVRCSQPNHIALSIGALTANATDNFVSGCGGGIRISSNTALAGRDSILRNRIEVPGLGTSGIQDDHSHRLVVRGNIIIGLDTTTTQAQVGIELLGPSSNCNSSCGVLNLVDSNVVQEIRGQGIYASFGDTLVVRGNTLSDIRPSFQSHDGAIGVVNTFEGGVTIYGNDILRAYRGVYGNRGDALIGQIDSNRIRLSGAALFIDGGTWTASRNALSGSFDGVALNFGAITLVQNNLTGSGHYGLADYSFGSGTIVADNNYWGGANGPRCTSNCAGGDGDSITDYVVFTPFLNTPFVSTPPPAPPAQLTARPMTAPRATTRAVPGSAPQAAVRAPAVAQRRTPDPAPVQLPGRRAATTAWEQIRARIAAAPRVTKP